MATETSLESTEAGRAWLIRYVGEKVRVASLERDQSVVVDNFFHSEQSFILYAVVRLCGKEFGQVPEVAPLLEQVETIPWFNHYQSSRKDVWRKMANALLERADTLPDRIVLAEEMAARSTPPLAKHVAKKWMILLTSGISNRQKQPERSNENVRIILELARATRIPALRKEARTWLRRMRGKHPPLENPEVDQLLGEES